MADAATSALVNVIIEKLADEVFKAYARAQGIHSELESLGEQLSLIQALLIDASDKETKEAVKLWLNRLQHLAYDIEDVLDDVATEAMRHELLTQESGASTSRKLVRNLLIVPTFFTNLSLSHRLSNKLDRINKELQQLYEEKAKLGLEVKDEKQKDYSNRGNETSLLVEASVVGRQVEKEKYLNKLLGGDESSSKETFSIVPIVGMGGVGKTTLAKLLYNDTKVQGHFELKAWVCVSDDFDVSNITKILLQGVSGDNMESGDLNQLQTALKEKLKDKRFLIVVDDVWNENYGEWENFVLPFHSGAPGSRMIMTTRKDQLLKKLGFDHLDNLHSLSDKDALSLFAVHALGVDNFDSHPTLREKGEGIVEKCGGLPLALKAIGRLLRTKADAKDWDAVLKSEIWDLQNVDDIVPALRLSYHDLSSNLKRLFAYCSLFPKDFLFKKEKLVLLWMAEGFLNQSNSTKSPEDFGQEDFEALLSKSFFQHAPNDESLYVMHDLMNDLATFVAKDFFLRFENHTKLGKEALTKYRHMSFIRERYEAYQKFEPFKRATSLRTLLAVPVDSYFNYFSNKILVDLLPQLPLLRVLSLSGVKISEVPDSVCSLKHLRYLNLSKTIIKELPENISNLFNLQTLIVSGCYRLEKLPKSFLKLKKLRHFDIRGTSSRIKLPLGIGELKSLQLTEIIIGGDDGFAITEIKGLNNLRGELSIEGLCNVQSAMHAHEAKLSLKRLTKLELNWGDGSQHVTHDKDVLKELKPDSEMLKKITIVKYGGIEFPKWVGDPSFQRLVHVSIRDCKNCTSLPPLGQLPSLEELYIRCLPNVKFIGSEFTGTNQSTVATFRSLEILLFEDMLGWEVWSTNNEVFDEVFPRLRKLYMYNCPQLIDVYGLTGWSTNGEVSVLPCLQELHIRNCPKMIEFLPERLPSLEILLFEDMLGWKIWSTKDAVFPRLRELRMYNCPKLVDFSAEALPLLRVLKISRCGDGVLRSLVQAASSITMLDIASISGLTCEVWRGVIEHIGAVEELSFGDCNEIRYLWESEEEASKILVNMKKLKVFECSNLVGLGEKDEEDNFGSSHLSSLRLLEVGSCHNMEHCCCPNSIESLTIFSCSSLTHVSFSKGGGGLKLKSLVIRECEKLMEKINNESMPMLEDIHIIGWINLKSIMQLGNFMYLTNLYISSCPSIESFPDIQLPVLTCLRIKGCERMESFSTHQNLTSLKELSIINCPSIDPSCHHGVWPPNLCSLELGVLRNPMSEWGLQHFPTSLVELELHGEPHVRNFRHLSHLFPSSLTTLSIQDFDKLESLSMGLQHLTSLKELNIDSCPKMKHLPKHLPSLQHLTIWRCQNLKHLPKQLLPSLLSLEIYGCPNLKERCEGRGSHYYPLISHIPCCIYLH